MILPRNSPNHKWRSFEKALKWVHKQNIKNKNDWKKLCNSKNFPKDIPKTPMHVYANELKDKGLGYWYGTNKKSTHKIIWRPFTEARKFVRSLEFQNTNEYRKWATTDKRPQDIPSAPKRIYKEFVDWEDWLGNKERKKKQFLSYFEAKKWAQSKKIESGKHWKILNFQKKIPKNIPGAPDKYYEEWESWPKFLGTSNNKMTYLEASQFVQSKKITSDTSLRKYKIVNKLPKNFPRAPENYYKRQGTWISWGDFTGTGRIATQKKSQAFLSAKEAKPVLKKLFKEYNINNLSDWKKFAKTHMKLLEELRIPITLLRTYSKQNAKRKSKKVE